ncbi:unnamed protein product [Owenia fusiformis]|uniref:Uncharacterized protein n=1 Tax=Owenia fusiformis TaxID=6347 RepID=A0A8J1Y9K0_OWEFU|nr:unnamed protein product [Owenia fusiformis]
MKLDDIFNKIGDTSVAQVATFILLGLVAISTGWQNVAINYIHGDMKHHCYVPQLEEYTFQRQEYIAIPRTMGNDGNWVYDSCKMFDLDWSNFTKDQFDSWDRDSFDSANAATRSCSSWSYDQSQFHSTAISKYDLVCDNADKKSLLETLYIAGLLVGLLVFGQIADSIGRKPVLLVAILVEVAFGVGAAFASDYVAFVVVRFFFGMAVGAKFIIAFVMVVEHVGPAYRTVFGVLMNAWMTVGMMSLPGIAYQVRNVQTLQMILAAPPAIFLTYFFLISETPRWLVTRGRLEQATALFHNMAKVNKADLPEDLELMENSVEDPDERRINLADMLRTPNLRKRLLIFWIIWLLSGLVYMGFTNKIKVGNNDYFNDFISGLTELLAYPVSILLISSIGRKLGSFSMAAMAAVLSFICIPLILTSNTMQGGLTAVTLFGKLCATSMLASISMWTVDTFPTVARAGVACASAMFAFAGGLIAPQINRLESTWSGLPSIIYAVLALLVAVITLALPETMDLNLPDTLNDGEWLGSQPYNEESKKPALNYYNSVKLSQSALAYDNKSFEMDKDVPHKLVENNGNVPMVEVTSNAGSNDIRKRSTDNVTTL